MSKLSNSIIAKYNNVICSVHLINKLDSRHNVRFIEFFEESDDRFVNKYKELYPNYSLKIFKSIKKPMPKLVKKLIENDSQLKLLLRSYNLNQLLDGDSDLSESSK